MTPSLRTGIVMAVILIFSPLLAPADPPATQPSPPPRIIEEFSDEKIGTFPASFKTFPFQRRKAASVYAVSEEAGNRFLRAEVRGKTQQIATQVFKNFYWDLPRWPRLTWRWRAQALPTAARGVPRRDDNACAVYVVFGGYGGKALKYAWSTDLPRGRVIEDRPQEFYVIITESGRKNLGHWQTVTLNILEEYRRFFKSDPSKNPSGIGLLTDGDGRKSPAVCDYDDFEISGP